MMMNKMQPGGMPMGQDSMPGMAEGAPAAEGEQGTVTIAKTPEGGFTVNGKPCKNIEEALAKAREILVGDDGGMSVEQAFRGGFKGDDGMGGPGMGGMGGGY